MRRKYIFVLCPPHQGSTVIISLLDKFSNVSSFLKNTNVWAGESQSIYKKYCDRSYSENRWNPEYKLDMNSIERIYDEYLDKGKNKIWVDKNPPWICRAEENQNHFEKLGDVYFIISIRNPYSFDGSISNWVKFAEYQKYNIKNLKNIICINYEEICLDTNKVISKIKNKISGLGKFNDNHEYEQKNERYGDIFKDKVNRVINKDEKNIILKENIHLLEFLGYKFID